MLSENKKGDDGHKMALHIDLDKCVRALAGMSARPTAPFYEARVARYILDELARLGLPVRKNEYGNIIGVYQGPSAPEGSLALVAHMDHPAFELIEVNGRTARGRLLGRVSRECFDRPVSVRVFPALPPQAGPDEGIAGRIVGYKAPEGGPLVFDLELDDRPPAQGFGIWDLPPLEVRDGLAYMRAVDDVVGCEAILLVLEALVERQVPCRCFGVFTRAEEVGMLGATLLAEERLLPIDTVVVSIETSKTLPGAEIGQGPVIRVGDRTRTFDGNAEAVLQAACQAMKQEAPEVKVQRQLMSGGSCEALMFIAEGYQTTAVALPLGNYHNIGPELAIEPEYIHLDDLATLVELLVRATEHLDADPSAGPAEKYRAQAEASKERLKASFAAWRLADANLERSTVNLGLLQNTAPRYGRPFIRPTRGDR